jgi:hypothetical protein
VAKEEEVCRQLQEQAELWLAKAEMDERVGVLDAMLRKWGMEAFFVVGNFE